jgi:hypothetical protein
VLLRGAALAAPLVTWLGPEHASRVHGPRVVPGPPRGAAMSWPPEGAWNDETESYRRAEVGAEGARGDGLGRGGGGGFDVVAAAPERERTFVLPKRVDGDTWLLLVAPDWAPTAFSWSTTAPGSELVLRRGAQLVVEARSADGLPVADLAVDYVPAAGEAAAVATRTDALGRAAFGRVLAGGTLRVSDARFANQSIELDEVPREPVALVVSSGVTCRGNARFAGDGVADATIVVTLRDPGGQLRPAERSVVASADGSFAFAGLPEHGAFVVFATAQRRGVTWSVRQDVRAGDDVALELRHEDPSLGPGGR